MQIQIIGSGRGQIYADSDLWIRIHFKNDADPCGSGSGKFCIVKVNLHILLQFYADQDPWIRE